MRVAIVGGNFLGVACAVEVRRALQDDAEIVLFEKAPVLGGGKFVVKEIDGVDVVVGTARGLDVRSCSGFSAVAGDAAGIGVARGAWGLWDWDGDEFVLGEYSGLIGRACEWLARGWVAWGVQGCLLSGLVTFWMQGRPESWSVVLAMTAVALGAGVVPLRFALRLWGVWVGRAYLFTMMHFNYGPSGGPLAADMAAQFKEQLECIRDNDSATSAVTVAHLLSACGLAKYARMSAAELFGKYNVDHRYLRDCVAPGMVAEYCDSQVAPTHSANALIALLAVLTRAPAPSRLRSRAKYLTPLDTAALCPSLAAGARADVRLDTEVVSVDAAPDGDGYDVGVRRKGAVVETMHFDGVVLAAVVDPDSFSTSVGDEPLRSALALFEEPLTQGSINTARYMSLIKGTLKPSFFRKSVQEDIPTHVTILNSVNCADVFRVAPGIFRIVSAEEPKADSSVIANLFEDTTEIISWKHAPRRYSAGPIRNLNGNEPPTFILGTRFLNASCTDRVSNHVEIDALSAHNVGSFFKEGIVNWK